MRPLRKIVDPLARSMDPLAAKRGFPAITAGHPRARDVTPPLRRGAPEGHGSTGAEIVGVLWGGAAFSIGGDDKRRGDRRPERGGGRKVVESAGTELGGRAPSG